MKILSAILKILGTLFVFLMLVLIFSDLDQQETVIQKIEEKITEMEKKITQEATVFYRDRILLDELLRKIYAREISLADALITKLDDYYSQNNNYPKPVGFIYNDLEKEIANKAGIGFYYTWLDRHYVLTYELPDGTGLVYVSETRLWGITEHLP
jgi:hypothetical protein